VYIAASVSKKKTKKGKCLAFINLTQDGSIDAHISKRFAWVCWVCCAKLPHTHTHTIWCKFDSPINTF